MDMLASLITYCIALSIAVAIPGPGIAALVGQSIGSGFRTALFCVAGIALGDVVYLTLAIAGLAAIANLFAGTFLLLKLLGGAYLLYLAWKFWRSDAGLTKVDNITTHSGRRAFLSGFAVTLGNPKAIIFYLALLPSVLDLGAVGPTQWAALCALTVLVLFVVLTPYALLASGARHMMARSGALLTLNRVAAGVIGSAGLVIAGQAASALSRRV
jgi:threonine/homoserine/homoserine lactone efflux protein